MKVNYYYTSEDFANLKHYEKHRGKLEEEE
jgi:hypothetical protein